MVNEGLFGKNTSKMYRNTGSSSGVERSCPELLSHKHKTGSQTEGLRMKVITETRNRDEVNQHHRKTGNAARIMLLSIIKK